MLRMCRYKITFLKMKCFKEMNRNIVKLNMKRSRCVKGITAVKGAKRQPGAKI